MESNDPSTVNSMEPGSGEASQDGSEVSKAKPDIDEFSLNRTNALLDELIQTAVKGVGETFDEESKGSKSAKGEEEEDTEGDKSKKEESAKGGESSTGEESIEASDAKANAVETTTSSSSSSSSHETQRHMFHLSDSMKKGLSMLAFPSKTTSRKKGITSSRNTSNSRITIGEALEKAQDVRKTMSHISANHPESVKGNVFGNSPGGQLSSDFKVAKGEVQSQRLLATGREEMELFHKARDSGSRFGEKENMLSSSTVPPHSMAAEGFNTDNEATTSSEGKREPLAGKGKPSATSRLKLTPRMGELLKFTFTHEHFPSSVHMARLAKMMGVQWSQIRNWFTDRRVASKKAGLFPRDKVLLFCPYCEVALKTEADQKNHLFSTLHVKKLLGPEYAGPTPTQESIKWKQLPKGVNAISKNTGNRILAVGYSKDKYGSPTKGKKNEPSPQKLVEAVKKENETHSEKLQKLWENSVLLSDKMENSAETRLVRKAKGKVGGHNFHKQTEITNAKLKPLECNDKGKGGVTSRIANHNNSLAAAEKMLITGLGRSSLVSQRQDHEVVNKGLVPEPYPGDPCSSKSIQEREAPEPPSPSDDCEVMYKISRGGHIIPNVTVRSSNAVKKPASVVQETELFNTSTTATTAQPSDMKNDYKCVLPSPKGGNKEAASANVTGSSTDSAPQLKVKQEMVTDNLGGNSRNLAPLQSNQNEKQETIKLEKPMFQAPTTTNTSSPRYIPSQVTQAARNQMPQIGRPTTSKYSSILPKETYKPQESFPVTRISQQPSGVKRTLQFQSPQTTTMLSQKTYNFRYSPDDNVLLGYQCPTCSKIFQTEWLMIKHSITHLKYHCNICDQVFPAEIILKHHLLDHLAWAYEDEKYYCQFACKTCHSLKCECYEPTYCKPRELPKRYSRPQKARRTKKTFITKLNSGPNDHLRVTLSDYKKLIQRSLPENANVPRSVPISQKAPTTTVIRPPVPIAPKPPILIQPKPPAQTQPKPPAQTQPKPPAQTHPKPPAQTHPKPPSQTQPKPPAQTQPKPPAQIQPKALMMVPLSVSEDPRPSKPQNACPVKEVEVPPPSTTPSTIKFTGAETPITTNTVTASSPVVPVQLEQNVGEDETENGSQGKRSVSRRKPPKLSSNFVYKDADFYYMCEICDASFLSKAELSEHMFFHRLKSRSRRGEKRGSPGFGEEENEMTKRPKYEEPLNNTEVEKITVGGFERFKCPMCRSHFASVTDLNRHKTQAHKTPDSELYQSENLSPTISDVYQCVYCEKVYRRDRELRRHLKHDCTYAPQSLKDSLSPGVNISCLQSVEGGPHFRIVKRNVDEHFLNEPGSSKSPSKGKGNPRGPITCKYCLIVTRREAEMKRHVWKYCPRIPKDIVRRFKAGASLEDLGFVYGVKDEVPNNSDSFTSEAAEADLPKNTSVTTMTSPVPTTVPSQIGSLSQDQTPYRPTSSPVTTSQSPQTVTSSQSSLSQSPNILSGGASTLLIPGKNVPLPVISGSSKSRHPLVCGYCGIWYFREQAILKHMKERCIRLPPYEKELLENGAQLCNVPQERSVSVSLAPGSIATYKMVQVPEQNVPNIPLPTVGCVSNRDIKILSSEVHEQGVDSSLAVSPVKLEPQTSPIPSPQEAAQISSSQTSDDHTLSPHMKKPGCKSRSGGSKGTRCRRCHEHFQSQDAVLAHSSIHHGPKKGFYKCKLCLVKLPKYKQLREHIWEHTNETPYRCHICMIKFRSSDTLLEHLRSQHEYNLANEKNLYKWLPDRNGKYREIKSPEKNCEESLDDIDASLDSLAEVMVITDRDICTSTPEKDKKSNKDVKSKLDESNEMSQSDKGLGNTNSGPGLQNPTLNGAKEHDDQQNHNNTHGIVCDQKRLKEVSPIKSDEIKQERDTKPNISVDRSAEKIIQTADAQKENYKSNDSLSDKETTEILSDRDGEEMEVCANSSGASDKPGDTSKNGTSDSSLFDSFTENGEGLLPSVDNLESVIETIQLTDRHLS